MPFYGLTATPVNGKQVSWATSLKYLNIEF